MGDVMRAFKWSSNAEMIEDVAKLGYLDGRVLDVTYGEGVFWKRWKPKKLVACDVVEELSPIGKSVDFRALPWRARSFDTVVIDGPYKLNGTPSAPDARYGVQLPARWQERHALIKNGMGQCARVSRKYVLVKCMDQVSRNKMRWQTHEFTDYGEILGLDLVDRFDMLTDPRPQDARRPQRHARSNYSTLLVFSK